MDTNTTATIFGRFDIAHITIDGIHRLQVMAAIYDTTIDEVYDLAFFTSDEGDIEALNTNISEAVAVLDTYCDTTNPGYFTSIGNTFTGFPANETWLASTGTAIADHYRTVNP